MSSDDSEEYSQDSGEEEEEGSYLSAKSQDETETDESRSNSFVDHSKNLYLFIYREWN